MELLRVHPPKSGKITAAASVGRRTRGGALGGEDSRTVLYRLKCRHVRRNCMPAMEERRR